MTSIEGGNIPNDIQNCELSDSEIEKLCALFGLGTLKKVVGTPGKGRVNKTILIKASTGNYVVRLLGHSTYGSRINIVEEMLVKFKEVNVPVVNAQKNKSGQYYDQMKGYYVQIYPYIEGETFSFKRNQIISCGKMLRKFHEAIKVDDITVPPPRLFIYPQNKNLEENYKEFLKTKKIKSNSTLEKIKTLYTSVMKKWSKTNIKQLPEAIIHDDWHPWNLIFNQNGSVAAILDFDYLQRGQRIFDLAYAIHSIYTTSSNSKDVATLLFQSYGELTSTEKTIFPLAVANVCLFQIFYFAKEGSLETFKKVLAENEAFINYLLSDEGKMFCQYPL
ncbi:phosphotransferase [Halalkalibacter kiskunsagensis]|uniref:Phosphotransferase n=1 Tax=Halalkalibacter kiskunsagensis TaxID=1548599 RepID=A0ABV6KBM2_9BACI